MNLVEIFLKSLNVPICHNKRAITQQCHNSLVNNFTLTALISAMSLLVSSSIFSTRFFMFLFRSFIIRSLLLDISTNWSFFSSKVGNQSQTWPYTKLERCPIKVNTLDWLDLIYKKDVCIWFKFVFKYFLLSFVLHLNRLMTKNQM